MTTPWSGSNDPTHPNEVHDHDHEPPRGMVAWFAGLFHPHSHDSADSVDAALESSAAGFRAVKVSLVVLLVTAVLQALVVAVTGSVALLADTIHNFSDALTTVPLWIAFSLSRRPASPRYTYGYGRAEDIAGVFIVAMIALSALVAGYESLRRLLNPEPVSHVAILIAAGLVGFAGNELVALYRIRIGRQIGSAALVADGLHARTDGLTSLAVVAGALGVLAGFPAADPIVGLVVTATILIVLHQAARDIYRRLMDATDPTLVRSIEVTLRATPGVRTVDEVRLRWIGHRMRAETGISVDPALGLLEAHAIAHEAEHRLLHEVPRIDHVLVHVSPDGHLGQDQHAVLTHHRRADAAVAQAKH